MVGFVILALLLTVQSIGSAYDGLTYVAWLWFVILYLPPLALLLKSSKLLNRSSKIPLRILTLLFVIISILGILLQPVAITSWMDGTIGAHVLRIRVLLYTLFLLLPLAGLIILIIKKNLVNNPETFSPPEEPTAFISYNHEDVETAKKIHGHLERANIKVIIDYQDMKAGEVIQNFIENSILNSTVTVCLVSNASLSSSWVATETIDAFFASRYLQNRRFIACCLEDDFFEDSYVSNTVKQINQRIEAKLKHKADQDELGVDSRNLNDEISRLRNLKNNLDGIIGTLRNGLSLDIGETHFDHNIKRLINDIKSEN